MPSTPAGPLVLIATSKCWHPCTHADVGVRWSFLRTEPQASVQLEQDEDLFRLSSESGHPHEVALPRGSHNEGRVSSPVPANLGGISAPVYSETCGSIASSHMKGPEVDGARSGASSPAARRSKSSSDLRLSRWGSQSTLLMQVLIGAVKCRVQVLRVYKSVMII
eukprot:1162015-Pelagomonas_calceolata.AAC.10